MVQYLICHDSFFVHTMTNQAFFFVTTDSNIKGHAHNLLSKRLSTFQRYEIKKSFFLYFYKQFKHIFFVSIIFEQILNIIIIQKKPIIRQTNFSLYIYALFNSPIHHNFLIIPSNQAWNQHFFFITTNLIIIMCVK